MNNEYGKMVLNPDVVVRSRGCYGKMFYVYSNDSSNNFKAAEGAVNTDEFEKACSSACTT
jgi:molybdopterin-containing oxidoreductase family iron-sulfur binding subunit